MTVLGKILVFVNLVFSLLVGGLVVMVYMARTNYADALVKEQKIRKDVEANAATYQQELKRIEKVTDSSVAEKEAELQKLRKDLADLTQTHNNLRDSISGLQQQVNQKDITLKQLQNEALIRQKDVEQMRSSLADALQKNTDLVKENGDLKRAATDAIVKADTLTDINKRLESRVRTLAQDLLRTKGQAEGAAPTASADGKNPPTQAVEGIVLNYDPDYKLIKLSIGSDSGIQKDHTLELFRLSKVSAQSRYLGLIKVIKVTEKEAVAQPVDRLNDTPQYGDTAASRIGS
jgi:chromosome segregation ATPase